MKTLAAITIGLFLFISHAYSGWVSSGKPADDSSSAKKEDLKGKPCPPPEKGQTLEDLIKSTGCVSAEKK